MSVSCGESAPAVAAPMFDKDAYDRAGGLVAVDGRKVFVKGDKFENFVAVFVVTSWAVLLERSLGIIYMAVCLCGHDEVAWLRRDGRVKKHGVAFFKIGRHGPASDDHGEDIVRQVVVSSDVVPDVNCLELVTDLTLACQAPGLYIRENWDLFVLSRRGDRNVEVYSLRDPLLLQDEWRTLQCSLPRVSPSLLRNLH